MTILIDTGFLFALFNQSDSFHFVANSFAEKLPDEIIVPIVVLPEVTFLFNRDMGHWGVQYFMELFASSIIPVENVTKSDLQRATQIMGEYQGAKLDMVDCCIIALAERLNFTQICTFDRRDFIIFRPKHCDYLELLP
jgi:uncharacterized protein